MKYEADSSTRLAELMRALDYRTLDLKLLASDDDVTKGGADKALYAPLWLRLLSGVLQATTYLGLFFFIEVTDSDQGVPDQNIWRIGLPLWFVLACCTYFVVSKKNSFKRERDAKLVKDNQLTEVPRGVIFPGDLASGRGAETAFHPTPDPKSPLVAVTFGTISGWWDPMSKVRRDGHGILFAQEFVHVSLPKLSRTVVYFSPKRLPAPDEISGLSDGAYSALRSLSSSYAVCVGEGGILVTLAGDTTNSFATSMMDGISTEKGWHLAYGLISGRLAEFVAGLE